MNITISESNNVIYNLALEEYFLLNKNDTDPSLYLWQNDNAVVIGRNQNIYMECDLEYAEKNGITVIRRLSGGGAVYHDMGNLNYTIYYKNNLIYKEQINHYLLSTLRQYGLNVLQSGRNDIEVNGKKISGTAYYVGETYSYQHGCLLVNSDLNILDRILHPDNSKIKSKGITSVKSRVMNMSDEVPEINVQQIKKALIENAWMLLGSKPNCEKILVKKINPIKLKNDCMDKLIEKYSSVKWNYGKEMDMSHKIQRRFPWGDCIIVVEADCSVITKISIYSDVLDYDIFSEISNLLEKTDLRRKSIMNIFNKLIFNYAGDTKKQEILKDIMELLDEEFKIYG